jgi:hypothetical protein
MPQIYRFYRLLPICSLATESLAAPVRSSLGVRWASGRRTSRPSSEDATNNGENAIRLGKALTAILAIDFLEGSTHTDGMKKC